MPPKVKQFGRYEILGEVGRGAMGMVYCARDPKIDRTVAIKTIILGNGDPQEENEYRERFFLEARAAGRLSHPGIVTIFDVAEERGTRAPYIVMEYVAGQSLQTMLANSGRLPFVTALQIAQELAEALDYAHSQGVVHRDIKPANILITQEGHAKIADFGIAKLNLAQLTVRGQTLGTPAYMAPEQLEGEAIDGRADLFSLGVILYAMLTGHRPFQGNSAATVSFKVVNRQPVPATAFDAEFPPEIDYLIARAIAKDKAQRYQTGREMALDLKELSRGHAPRSIGDPALPKAIAAMPASSMQKVQDAVPTEVPAIITGFSGQLGATTHPTAAAVNPTSYDRRRADGAKTSFIAAMVLFIIAGLWGWYHKTPKVPSQVAHAAVPPAAVSLPVQATPAPTKPAAKPLPSRAATIEHSTAASDSKATHLARTSKLDLRVEHPFKSATLSVWVDGRLALTTALEGKQKKRLVVFHGIHGSEQATVSMPAGTHDVKIRIQSVDGYDQTEKLTDNFSADQTRTLHVRCNKHDPLLTLALK